MANHSRLCPNQMAITAQKSLNSACELVTTTAQVSNVVDSDIIYRQVITIRPARKEADLLDSIEPNALVRPQTQILESQDFKKWQRHQTEARLKLGDNYIDHGFVFGQDDGQPMHPDSVTSCMKKFSFKQFKET